METVLEVKDVTKIFYQQKKKFTAVDQISFTLQQGECLGLVGESGCGKSTTARMVTGLLKPDQGSIHRGKGEIQMVFQSPQDSFDPRWRLGDSIMEGMHNQGIPKEQAKKRMLELLEMVELTSEYASRYPSEVSGGQCQRAAIARVLAGNPSVIVCDEATSALDVTVQAQIADLLKRLQKEMSLSLLLICHDLPLVQYMCNRVLVMYQGRIEEEGTTDQIIKHPQKEYTRKLIEAVL